ncbi:hypothetical protein SBA4_870029 [Candidatus Sulfopaludibacter sp. SbA4]|nr:hypothetical protein SBA4_870029 [Candidatus Sulfopaludibacter sp. SbA4]
MPFPYIFTFYSYKGGVGRSMAVMNVAYTLAGRGRHVLLLDMDLEAPGLTGFLVRNQEFAPVADHRLDVLDLLGEAIRAAPGSGAVKEKVAKLPPVSNYIRPVSEEKLAALRPKMGQMGRLDVLGTDQSPKYFDRLAELDLRKLGHEGLVALSNLLHFYFKAQVFPHRPLGIESFEPPIQTPYDYVLVDSRTGMTEIGGLCVGPLSDRLVVMTSLNDQNVQGTLTFLQEAGIKTVPRLERDEKWDDADEVRAPGTDNANLGPKPTIVVASPVPYGEVTYKGRRLDELKKLLGIRPVSLSYHPHMALMETIFVRDYPEEYLASVPEGDYTRNGASGRRSAELGAEVTGCGGRGEGSGEGDPAGPTRCPRRAGVRHSPVGNVGKSSAVRRPRSGGKATARFPRGQRGKKTDRVEHLGQRAIQPSQDEDRGGSRPTLRGGRPKVRRSPPAGTPGFWCAQQLGCCTLRPSQDEDRGGSRQALRGGGRKVRRSPPAETGGF